MRHFPYQYIARIVIEAETALSVGSDSLLLEQDNPVLRDYNGLPMIAGTAIAGFLSRKLDKAIFGQTEVPIGEQTIGSNIIISDALLYTNNMVHQQVEDLSNNDYLKNYWQLPIRPHAAHTHRGTAKAGAFYDNEVVYKGSQFKFEIALEMPTESDSFWNDTLNSLCDNDFYLGSGQFDAMGELVIKEIKVKQFNLNIPEELNDFSDNYSVDLNSGNFDDFPFELRKTRLNEVPPITFDCRDSFFHFGSGFGDFEVNDTNYKEAVAPSFEEQYIIPGTSIKGSLAHRIAYYSNLENNNTIEKLIHEIENKVSINNIEIEEIVIPDILDELKSLLKTLEDKLEVLNKAEKDTFETYTGSNIEAVIELFGKAKKSETETGSSGKIIISDIYLKPNTTEIIFQHNKIDRYTQGTIDTALYSEKVLAIDEFTFLIKGEKTAIENVYFNKALDDLKAGRLSIGGKTNKGHGILKLKI